MKSNAGDCIFRFWIKNFLLLLLINSKIKADPAISESPGFQVAGFLP